MQHDHIQNFCLPFDRIHRLRVCVGREYDSASMVLYAPFPLICYATYSCSEKVEFDLLTPRSGGGGGLRAKYLLPSCCICGSL